MFLGGTGASDRGIAESSLQPAQFAQS